MKSFHEAQNYLYSLVPPEGKTFPGQVGLDRMRKLIEALGNPHKKYPIIHITGTSGKGSVCAILSSVLSAAGYKTGLHVSPHVVSIKERMQVYTSKAEAGMMTDKEFVRLVQKIRPVIEEVSKEVLGPVTYFEAVLALAFQHFADSKVDIAVVETGMGGTYDGTNVVDSMLSVITPIGYDHMQVLGNTLIEIAGNKAGIIKKTNRAVIVAQQKPEAEKVVSMSAVSKSVPMVKEGIDFNVSVSWLTETKTVFDYDYKKRGVSFRNLELSLLGRHQAHNAGLAITVALELKHDGFTISEEVIRTGLREVKIPGRLEVLSLLFNLGGFDRELSRIGWNFFNPRGFPVAQASTIILDGAHNEDKMKALVAALQELWPGKKFRVVFACKKNKDMRTMLRTLLSVVEKVYITEFHVGTDMGNKLSMSTVQIEQALKDVGFKGQQVAEPNSIEALQKSINESVPEDVILVTGSLYLVSELREYLLKTPDSLG